MPKQQIDTSITLSIDDFSAQSGPKRIEKTDVETVPKTLTTDDYATVEREPYLPDTKLVEVVNLAVALGRPLLLQGEPGCGKTRLADALAYTLGLPLEICPITSSSRARDLLYSYDAVKRLYDSQMQDERSRDVTNYIHYGPLGRAIIRAGHGRRSVVLIDEIDKADLDFPNDLLWELDRLEFRVAEAPNLPAYKVDAQKDPGLRPIVIVTNNEEKALPAAFLRRCIFHYIPFPEKDSARLQEILELHDARDARLSRKAIEVLLNIRRIEHIRKKPGISELLDWTGYMQAAKTPVEELERVPYIGALLKQEYDRLEARKRYPEDPAPEQDC